MRTKLKISGELKSNIIQKMAIIIECLCVVGCFIIGGTSFVLAVELFIGSLISFIVVYGIGTIIEQNDMIINKLYEEKNTKK